MSDVIIRDKAEYHAAPPNKWSVISPCHPGRSARR